MINIHKKIYNIIETLQNISSSNKKKEVLNNYFDGDNNTRQAWIKFLDYTYNEVSFVYNLKKIPEVPESINNIKNEFSDLIDILDLLNTGSGGETEKEEVVKFLEFSDFELRYLFNLAIDRNLNAGVEATTLTKCYPELDHLVSPYMRCEKEDALEKRIKYPAIAQIKADGLFINCFLGNYSANKRPKYITRYGNNVVIEGGFNTVISMLSQYNNYFSNKVLMGELLLRINGEILSRKVGNGRINSYIKRFETIKTMEKNLAKAKTEKAKAKILEKHKLMEEDWERTEKGLLIKYWDIIPEENFYKKYDGNIYINRILELNKNFTLLNDKFPNKEKKLLLAIDTNDTKMVYSKKDIYDFFEEVLKKGEEGLVVKNIDLDWCHDVNRKGIIKLKGFKDCDLKIVGFNPGEGEYTGGIGSLICESSDGLLIVDPSSGLSMEQRGLERVDLNDSSKGWKSIEGFDMNQYTGKIVALKYNELMSANDKGIYSLFLPIIEEIRESFDKQEADSLEKIIKDNKGKI